MKILIADPHPEVQAALHLVAARLPEASQVSEVSNLIQLLAQCAQDCPELILFDIDLAYPSRGHAQPLVDLLCVLRRLCPGSKLVAMSSRFEAEKAALAAGANGFISKTDSPDLVLASILRFLFNDGN